MRPAKCFQSEAHSIFPKGYIILCMENRCGQVCVSIFSFFRRFLLRQWRSLRPPAFMQVEGPDRQAAFKITERRQGSWGLGGGERMDTAPGNLWLHFPSAIGRKAPPLVGKWSLRPSPALFLTTLLSCVSFTYPVLIVSHIHAHMHTDAYKHKHTPHTSREGAQNRTYVNGKPL